MSQTNKKAAPGWLPMALDFGPLIAFFLGYRFLGVIAGTAIFMVTIAVAVAVSQWKLGRVSPMLWLSAILVIGFGALTIWLNDPRFIQIKPTAVYVLLAGLLFAGLARGKPLLKYVFEHGYSGLSEKGWLLFSRNWAVFFLAMAGVNEIVRHNFDFATWLTIKVWGMTILSMVFAAANIPMLMKHGLGAGEPAQKSQS